MKKKSRKIGSLGTSLRIQDAAVPQHHHQVAGILYRYESGKSDYLYSHLWLWGPVFFSCCFSGLNSGAAAHAWKLSARIYDAKLQGPSVAHSFASIANDQLYKLYKLEKIYMCFFFLLFHSLVKRKPSCAQLVKNGATHNARGQHSIYLPPPSTAKFIR